MIRAGSALDLSPLAKLPDFYLGGADASPAECHAQNHRSPAPEVRDAIESRADRGGDRPVQGRGEQLRAAGRAEEPRLAAGHGNFEQRRPR